MATRSLRARFTLDMDGNLVRTGHRFGGALRRLGRNADEEFGRIGRGAAAMDRKLNRTLVRGTQAATAAAVAAGAASIRHLASVEQVLERLGIDAGKNTEEMEAFRNSVNDVAKDPQIKINPDQLIAGIAAFTEATGEFDLADQIKREMALAIQATGSGGAEIGALMASLFQKFDIDTPDAMLQALDLMVLQGRMGAIELRNLASLGPKVFSAFRRQGQGGLEGLAEAGGLMQVFKEGVGSPQEAATVFENVINNLYDPTKLDRLAKLKPSDRPKLKGDDGEFLGPAELLKSIITSADGVDINLKRIFDNEAFRGVGLLSKMYRETGGFGGLDKFADVRGDGAAITDASARMAATTSASGTALATNVRDRVEDNLLGPLKDLTDAMNALIDDGVEFTIDDAATIAIGGAVALGLTKAGLGGARMLSGRGRRGGRGGRGGGSGKPGVAGLADAAGVTPVFVTNWPVGFGAGDGGRGRKGGGRRAPGVGGTKTTPPRRSGAKSIDTGAPKTAKPKPAAAPRTPAATRPAAPTPTSRRPRVGRAGRLAGRAFRAVPFLGSAIYAIETLKELGPFKDLPTDKRVRRGDWAKRPTPPVTPPPPATSPMRFRDKTTGKAALSIAQKPSAPTPPTPATSRIRFRVKTRSAAPTPAKPAPIKLTPPPLRFSRQARKDTPPTRATAAKSPMRLLGQTRTGLPGQTRTGSPITRRKDAGAPSRPATPTASTRFGRKPQGETSTSRRTIDAIAAIAARQARLADLSVGAEAAAPEVMAKLDAAELLTEMRAFLDGQDDQTEEIAQRGRETIAALRELKGALGRPAATPPVLSPDKFGAQ